jgi:hypothetical protein
LSDNLSEAQLRYLRRVADQMRARGTVRIEIDLKDGGVGSYREVRTLRPADLDESDGEDYARAS